MPNNPIVRRTFTIGPGGPRRFEIVVHAPVADGDDCRRDYEIIEDGKIANSFHGMGVDTASIDVRPSESGALVTSSDYARTHRLYCNGRNEDLGLLLPPSPNNQRRAAE